MRNMPSTKIAPESRPSFAALMCVVLLAICSGRSLGQDQLIVGSVTAEPGQLALRVPILATTASPLTLLSADVTFDRALCARIANQDLKQAGRATQKPQEGGLRCPADGRVSVVILDLLGGTSIPAGDGVIAEWVFDVLADAAPGVFPLALTLNQASNGPLNVPLALSAGTLTIAAVVSPAACRGDCDEDGVVSVSELIRGVNVALGMSPASTCPPMDRNGDQVVMIDELVEATTNALTRCPE